MIIFNFLITKTLPLLPKWFAKPFASPYVAGETIEEVIQKVKNLNKKGFLTTVDILGEHIKTKSEARKITNDYCLLYDKIFDHNLDCTISVKPTHLGLDISKAEVLKNLRILTEKADKTNNFLRLDMENVPYTSETIKLYKEMFEDYNQIGIVIQAYLLRSLDDIKSLSNEKFNVRICKGIYVENPELVLNDYNDIRQNFICLVKEAINNGSYVGIATHDEFLIDNLYEWIIQNNISKNQFEFQVLHGVPMKKKLKKLMNEGNTVRVYLPYGDNWYDYSVRRLKENPKMAGYIIKNLLLSIFRIK